MAAMIVNQIIPIAKNARGVILVGGTRVPLDTVVLHYNRGESAEEIRTEFPTLELADIHFVIGYYLKNRNEVETYLKEREKTKKKVRKMVEARSNMSDLRKRLHARQIAQKKM